MKKVISLFLVFCMLFALSGAAASAMTIVDKNTYYEKIVAEPTVYLGEILRDGETVMTYINCENYINLYNGSSNPNTALASVICGMDNSAFAQLIADYQAERNAMINDYHSGVISELPQEAPCIRLCSDPDLTESMDASWNSAATVAAQYYPEATLTSESSENAYDVDEGFRTALAADNERREAEIDKPATAEKSVIQVYDAFASTNVYYTEDNGEIIKHRDTTVTLTSYAITVIYTRAELSTAPASADFEYRALEDGTLEITNYLGTDSEVTVPAAIDGKTVTSIAAADDAYWVFAWQDENYDFQCPSVIHLPDTVTNIGDFAFAFCSDLTDVNIPNGVTHIGDYAFSGCEGLTEITVPDSVTSMGCEVFDSCTALETVVLPDSLTEIPRGTFIFCESLQNVTLPSGLTAIGDDMFNGCTSLTSIVIPETVTSIGQNAFYDTGLTSITIPRGTAVNVTATVDDFTYELTPVGYMTDPDTGDTVKVDGFVIRCYHGSSAEAYATACGFAIEYLDAALRLGDADGDGDVMVLDVTAIQRKLAGMRVESFNEKAANLSGNGLDITDATYIQRYLAGIETPYPIGKYIDDGLDV